MQKSILETLVDLQRISHEDARRAQLNAGPNRNKPVQILLNEGLITEQDVLDAAQESGRAQVVQASEITVDPQALMAIPGDIAKTRLILPVKIKDGILTVVLELSNVANVELRDDLKRRAGARRVDILVSSREELERAITTAYRAEGELKKIAEAEEAESQQARAAMDATARAFEEQVEDSAAAKFVTLLLNQAIDDGASDIHIEPNENTVYIRFRIDGVLHDVSQAPISMASEISTRIKVLSDIDIAERRKPQDGRLTRGGTDLRVAILPTVWGEKIVMRILDNSQASLELSKLGFSPHNLDRFSSAYKKPYGMILVTGPTGSGKSTTLYAALNQISSPDINIITVEDPVEYRVPRINQVQVNPKANLTFPSALRSILRSDPDVILIGEIRDAETARIAVESAQTGHLVLSTLHTNDSASAVSRLSEMGVEPFLVASVLESVLAQRLIRKLCPNCKVSYQPKADELDIVGFPYDPTEPLPTLYRAEGCRECAKTGYKGRMAVHEVLLMTPELAHTAAVRGNSAEINRLAIEGGMRTMKQDGWERVLQGVTSIPEILRVIA